ncbi:MAG: family 10 glycosylhydrolase [Cyanobacteria bacterium SID2]|nr:family 10 glycosylhydrolase [Cyanobacteria bacterium SID2]MBP0006321.1 family 10 glycosylhydrolase [Cyanobacteria bacterium SBC]
MFGFFATLTDLGRRWSYSLAATLATTALTSSNPTLAELPHSVAPCRLPAQAVVEKEMLRQEALSGDTDALGRYQIAVARHRSTLQQCRQQNWPRRQAIWLRLYPCDAKSGRLEQVLDRIVNHGYNEVYLETFYDGQVLLPANDNPTPWPSVARSSEFEEVDLLAQAIEKGRERGLKVYAWLFTMNFGYAYGQRSDRASALARNGENLTTLNHLRADASNNDSLLHSYASQAFIDPYSPQARRDYQWLVYSVLQRQPDGVLFDYVRYPRLPGAESVATKVSDLWIYGEASRTALLQRARNDRGRALLERYLDRGYLTEEDVRSISTRYPQDGEPLWQATRTPNGSLQTRLWHLSVAHAVQGILDFLDLAVQQVDRQNIPAGAVFFPNGNQPVGDGFDSRLQPWDRFPASMEWHPMLYGVCGNASCILTQLERVLALAPEETEMVPALAGVWGEPISNRPSLEAQMYALRQAAPQIDAVSHFAYSWQFPESDRNRKMCE